MVASFRLSVPVDDTPPSSQAPAFRVTGAPKKAKVLKNDATRVYKQKRRPASGPVLQGKGGKGGPEKSTTAESERARR